MTDYHLQKKLERLHAVRNGKWRNKEGIMLDLYDQQQVPDKYLYTIISECDRREKRDISGIDAEIKDLLTNIYKNRQNKHMNTHQLELFQDNNAATHAAVDASVKINRERSIMPQMFQIGQIVKNKEIIGVKRSNKGVIKGLSYTVMDRKTGEITNVKQSLLLPKNKSKVQTETTPTKASKPAKTKKKAKNNTKVYSDPQKEQSMIIRKEFPVIRMVLGKENRQRYIVDSRYNKNYKSGDTEFFDDSSLAFDRAKTIAEIAKKNQEEATKTFDIVMETASAKTQVPMPTITPPQSVAWNWAGHSPVWTQQEPQAVTPPNEKQVDEYISSMTFTSKLKFFFKNII
jgi:hypothetical protein